MYLQRQFTYQAGVTLVELMISLALGAILLWGVTSVMVSGHLSYSEAQRFTALQGDFSYINDSILVDSRGATGVATANNGTVLTLTTAAGAVVYQRNNNNELTRQLNADPASIVAENVNMFTVACLDPLGAAVVCGSAVQIETTVELTTSRGDEDRQHRISFRSALRNAVLQSKFQPAAGA